MIPDRNWIRNLVQPPRAKVIPPCIGHALLWALFGVVAAGCGSPITPTSPVPQSTEVDVLAESTPAPRSTLATSGDAGGRANADLREAAITRSEEFAARREFAAAAAELNNLLLVEPNDAEVLFRLADLEAKQGNLQKAIDVIDEIPDGHPEASLPAWGQSADWCFQLQRYDEAEKRYRKLLDRVPDAAPALRQLAYLLNRQGRRHEAAKYVRALCRQGNVSQDELHSLIVLSDAMYDEPSDSQRTPSGARPYWPIGASGQARKRFDDGEFQETINLLHESVAGGTAPAAVVALYGRAATEAQDDARISWWLTKTNAQTREHADYWAAVGTFELTHRRFPSATRALAEALDRDPTDLASMSRIRQALGTLGDDAGAQRWFDRWNAARDMIEVNNRVASTQPPASDALAELASMLSNLDRPLEAVLWRSIQGFYHGESQSQMRELNAQRETILASGTAFPSRQARLCGLDLHAYPLPELRTMKKVEAQLRHTSDNIHQVTPARLENVATSVGLNHTYHVASQAIEQHFSIYQTLGGGVAVLDYDLDGWSDLYLAQGGADPPSFGGSQTNQLFRQQSSRLVDVTIAAAADEDQYSIGLTAGDWNQDGFPDLTIANIGTSTLLINNGDGTFTGQSIYPEVNTNRVPSSVAMADITGDHLPDLFHVHYVDDQTMVVKPPIDDDGQVQFTVSPNSFDPCADWLIENDGAGDFAIQVLTSRAEARTGLGVVIANLDGRAGNDVFVGNDTYPNRLWVRDPDGQLSDVAPLLGCAYGFSGGATGAMGIAAGDFDRNEAMDLHVANYENESANLYLRNGNAYEDRNVQYRLADASRELVAFGSQAIDYDNDGDLDLAVTNGHLDDAKSILGTFRQPPQLFCNLGDRFQIADVADPSDYWTSKHVGRAMATFDYDRDGKLDLVITHIEQPSALLINRTPSNHHWLQLQLVGTTSERDSIGARIQIRMGRQRLTGWVIAGDGYLCHNEAVVCFGLGAARLVDEIEIHWPSGGQQTFRDVQVDQRLLVVENQDSLYSLGLAR